MLTLPVTYSEKLETVERVDLHRFIGKWYTVANLLNRNPSMVLNNVIEYKLTNKGSLHVSKSYKIKSRIFSTITLHATATVKENSNNSKFKIQYLWPFAEAAWVIDLADDYTYAVICNPSKTSLTILSRNRNMDSSTYSAIIERIKNKGFNTDRLKKASDYIIA